MIHCAVSGSQSLNLLEFLLLKPKLPVSKFSAINFAIDSCIVTVLLCYRFCDSNRIFATFRQKLRAVQKGERELLLENLIDVDNTTGESDLFCYFAVFSFGHHKIGFCSCSKFNFAGTMFLGKT